MKRLYKIWVMLLQLLLFFLCIFSTYYQGRRAFSRIGSRSISRVKRSPKSRNTKSRNKKSKKNNDKDNGQQEDIFYDSNESNEDYSQTKSSLGSDFKNKMKEYTGRSGSIRKLLINLLTLNLGN